MLLWNAFLRWLSPVMATHSSTSRLTVEIWGEQMVLGKKSQCLLWLLPLAEQVASGVSLTLPRACVWRAGLVFPIFPLANDENLSSSEILVRLERVQKHCWR